MSSASRPPLTPIGSALAGALGAVVSNAVVYPLDTVKTRLQALPDESLLEPTVPAPQHGKTSLGGRITRVPVQVWRRLKKWKMLAMLLRIIKTEGVSGAFKGFPASMLQTFSQQFAYFFFHTWIRGAAMHQLSQRSGIPSTSLSTSAELLLGAAAGALAQIFTIPVSVIATRQQLWSPPTDRSPGSSSNTKGLSLMETAKEIIDESGPTGLWTGLKPGLVLTVNPAITYGAFERIKSYVLVSRGGGGLSMMENFWIGVVSKAIATVVTYPYIFAKVRLQAKAGDPEPLPELAASAAEKQEGISYADAAAQPPSTSAPVVSGPETGALDAKPTLARRRKHAGAVSLLRAVYAQKGFGGWYQGLTAQIVKAVLCQGILFVSKDQFEQWTWIVLAALTRLRAKIPIASR